MAFDIVGDELILGDDASRDIVGEDIYGGDPGYFAISGDEAVTYMGADPEIASLMQIAGEAPMVAYGAAPAARRVVPVARRRPTPVAPVAPAQPVRPIQPVVRPQAVGLVERKSQRRREYPLGFTSNGPVGPGAIVNIAVQPQLPFRAERLIIPSDYAGSFQIVDLKIGKNSQLVAAGNIPARAFSENAVGVRLMMDTAQVSQIITLTVQNVTATPVPFSAVLIGVAVE